MRCKYNKNLQVHGPMELNFNKIVHLKKVRIEKSKLSEEENMLAMPILSDKKLIGEIYDIFCELLNDTQNIDSVSQRKKFLFIILYLFSPSTLAGGKMLCGLRDELAKVLKVQSKTTISDNCNDIVFLYQNYADFWKDINLFYPEIVNRLKNKGVIK